MKCSKILVLVGLLATASAAFAFNKSMYPYDLPSGKQGAALGCIEAKAGMTLELGKWYTNFQVCKAYADANGIPLVAVWSNEECVHCWYTDVVFVQQDFLDWKEKNNAGKVIYCFMAGGYGGYDQVNSAAYNWMWYGGGTKLNAYPFVVLWWAKENVNERYTGDNFCNSKDFTDKSIPGRVTTVISRLEKAFAKWEPVTYAGGTFSGTTDVVITNGVQSQVTFALSREEKFKDVESTNWVTVAFNDQAAQTNATIVWKNELKKDYTLDLAWNGLDHRATNTYAVCLLDADGEVQSTANVTALPLPYLGGAFAATDYCTTNGWEVSVELNFSREDYKKGYVATNRVVVSYDESSAITNNVEWKVGETTLSYTLSLDRTRLDAAVTNVLDVCLFSDLGEDEGAARVTVCPYPDFGGKFLTGATASDSLSMIAGTTDSVAIPLARIRTSEEGQNVLVVTYQVSVEKDEYWDVYTNTVYQFSAVTNEVVSTNKSETLEVVWSNFPAALSGYTWQSCDPGVVISATNRVYDAEPTDYRLDVTNAVAWTDVASTCETNAWRDVVVAGTEIDSVPVTNSVPALRTERQVRIETNVVTTLVKIHVPATNYIETVCVTQDVVFAKGDDQVLVNWDVPANTTGHERRSLTGSEITLELYKEDGTTLVADGGVSKIKVVSADDVKNSSSNPYWIGERTAETLNWGEWTMDLDAAQKKAAAEEGYTLILVGGSKWCPDCVNTDRWLLDQAAFKAWAQTNKVACVTIDIPKVDKDADGKTTLAAYPSLLTYDSYRVSDRYVGTNENVRVQSGAAYLSLHQIPLTGNGGTNATAIAERNATLFMTSTADGGLCRPDCLDEANEQTKHFKTGVPCLILMDKEGRIVGRNFQFNNKSPIGFKDAYISRLDELLEQAKDEAEESNDSYQTTMEIVPTQGTVKDVAVSYNDLADWYWIRENAVGKTITYKLSGASDAASDAKVSLAVVQFNGKAENKLQKVTGSLKDGLEVAVKIPTTNCFVCVSVPLTNGVTTDFFALDSENSTKAEYKLTSAFTLAPTEVVQTYVEEDDAETVSVQVESGKAYKFVGAGDIADDNLVYDALTGLYTAKADGTVAVPLLEDTPLEYQIWNPGEVSFSVISDTADEPSDDDEYVEKRLSVKRLGGTSGVAKVRLDAAEGCTELEGIYECKDVGSVHMWQEGETNDWVLVIKVLANAHYDGEQTVKFALSALKESDAAVTEGKANYTLTINDNETTASPGKLRIASTVPAKAGRYVYAKASEGVVLNIGRTGGSDGEISGVLTATKGAFDKSELKWKSRDAKDQTVKLSFADVAKGGSVDVKLKAVNGSKVVSSESAFTVKVIADNAPSFETDAVAYSIYRSVDMGEEKVGVVNTLLGSTVKVTRISGSIPGGIRAVYDAASGSLVFSGVATSSAGKFEAVYQVSAGSVKGLVVSVKFTVTDPFKASPQTGAVLNAACAKARTFQDLQVYSDDEMSRLVGLVTLTIPSSGRLSAKYTSASGTVSLMSKSWSAIDIENAMTAELQGTTAKTKGYRMTVKAAADGSLACSLVDPAESEEQPLVVRVQDDEFQPLGDGAAANWAGYYTVSLAQKNPEDASILAKGDGYLTLKMATNAAILKGRMAYAGVLPNGKAFTGSRVLWGCYNKVFGKYVLAYLPVFSVSSANDVSGLLLITPTAEEVEEGEERRRVFSDLSAYGIANRFIWTSKEGQKAGKDYEVEFEAFGGIYDESEDFADCCAETFETDLLTFFAMPQLLDVDAVWTTDDTQVSAAPITKTVNRVTVEQNNLALVNAKNSQNLTLSFNRATGLVSGTLNLTIDGVVTKASYKGVVLPGWGSASCAECSAPSDAQERPFVSGACYFKQKSDGNLTWGCPFSIGLEEGR